MPEVKKELDLDKTVKDLKITSMIILDKIGEINSKIQEQERSINFLKEERDRLHEAYKIIVNSHHDLQRTINPFAELEEIEFD